MNRPAIEGIVGMIGRSVLHAIVNSTAKAIRTEPTMDDDVQ